MIVRITLFTTRQCLLRAITPKASPQTSVPKFTVNRSYATHRKDASDLLSQTLDVKRGSRREDTVGPFILGVVSSQQSAENVKRWSELSSGGKGVCRQLGVVAVLTVICTSRSFLSLSRSDCLEDRESGRYPLWSRILRPPFVRPNLRTVLQKLADCPIQGCL